MGEFRRTRPITEECERCGAPVTYSPDDVIPDVVLCPNCR